MLHDTQRQVADQIANQENQGLMTTGIEIATRRVYAWSTTIVDSSGYELIDSLLGDPKQGGRVCLIAITLGERAHEKLLADLGHIPFDGGSSVISKSSGARTSLRAQSTDLSRTFDSSRTFPGQS